MAQRIKAVARIRPPGSEEELYEERVIHTSFTDPASIPSNDHLIIQASNGLYPTKQFKLDALVDVDGSQSDVFREVEPQLEKSLHGYNCCICTYGQTGSGKTHTMLGEKYMAQNR